MIDDQKPIFLDSKKKVFFPKNPNLAVQYVIKYYRINGRIAVINDNKILTIKQITITVFDTMNSEQTIPKTCQGELKRDLTQWLRESVGKTKLTTNLPSFCVLLEKK